MSQIGRVEQKTTQGCLPKSCHSLSIGIENLAGILNGWFWPGRAKEEARLFAEKLPFVEISDEKLRRHRQRPVMADSVEKVP